MDPHEDQSADTSGDADATEKKPLGDVDCSPSNSSDVIESGMLPLPDLNDWHMLSLVCIS